MRDFCRHYLAHSDNQPEKVALFAGAAPPDLTSSFAKLMGRLGSMLTAYSKLALKDLPGTELDWFYCLNAIFHQGEARKIDIITYNFFEQTTGIDLLNRLKKLDYLTERPDPADKRAKLVQLTKAGEELLFRCYAALYPPAHLLFAAVPDEDKQLILTLLAPAEVKHGKILADARGKSFADLLHEALSEEQRAGLAAYQQRQIADFARNKHS